MSYDIQEDASRQIPYETAVPLFATAFSKWTGVTCSDSSTGSGSVSIAVSNLGPVACDQVQYSSDQGNQHVIIFHDDTWPYDDPNNTLGLTTITFDPDTGEIYDADMEINSTQPLTISGPLASDGYDFLSIITHETGHFFGMAHSNDDSATMFAHYAPGTMTMREEPDWRTTPPESAPSIRRTGRAKSRRPWRRAAPFPRTRAIRRRGMAFRAIAPNRRARDVRRQPSARGTRFSALIVVAAAALVVGARRARRRLPRSPPALGSDPWALCSS